jgi:cellobiose-specific phosphotransferase system component IIC
MIPNVISEMGGNPALAKLGIANPMAMEGKEVRFGVPASAYWQVMTTVISTGSVNSMHDSSMPLSGAMQMLGMNELITIAKYYKQWSNPQLLIVVINNMDLNMVTWEMRALGGYPKFEESQTLPDVSFAAFARSIGLEGVRIEMPHQIPAALDEAFAANKPVVIEAVCDATVPILPPHMTATQMKNFVAALLKGDPEAGDIIRQVYRQVTAG